MRRLLNAMPHKRALNVAAARRRRLGERGVTALEFALVAPTVILSLFFAIEMAVMMMADATLGRVAADIARQGQMYKLNSADCTGNVRSLLASGMSNWVYDENNLIVEVAIYERGAFSPDPPATGNYEALCSNAGRNALLVYTVGFTSPGFSGILRMLNIDIMRFQRGIILQNEP